MKEKDCRVTGIDEQKPDSQVYWWKQHDQEPSTRVKLHPASLNESNSRQKVPGLSSVYVCLFPLQEAQCGPAHRLTPPPATLFQASLTSSNDSSPWVLLSFWHRHFIFGLNFGSHLNLFVWTFCWEFCWWNLFRSHKGHMTVGLGLSTTCVATNLHNTSTALTSLKFVCFEKHWHSLLVNFVFLFTLFCFWNTRAPL